MLAQYISTTSTAFKYRKIGAVKQWCQTRGQRAKCGSCKDFVPQCECLVSQVCLRKLRENGRQMPTTSKSRGGRGYDLFFGDQHHSGLHPIALEITFSLEISTISGSFPNL